MIYLADYFSLSLSLQMYMYVQIYIQYITYIYISDFVKKCLSKTIHLLNDLKLNYLYI